jgi:hypothetical protein
MYNKPFSDARQFVATQIRQSIFMDIINQFLHGLTRLYRSTSDSRYRKRCLGSRTRLAKLLCITRLEQCGSLRTPPIFIQHFFIVRILPSVDKAHLTLSTSTLQCTRHFQGIPARLVWRNSLDVIGFIPIAKSHSNPGAARQTLAIQ